MRRQAWMSLAAARRALEEAVRKLSRAEVARALSAARRRVRSAAFACAKLTADIFLSMAARAARCTAMRSFALSSLICVMFIACNFHAAPKPLTPARAAQMAATIRVMFTSSTSRRMRSAPRRSRAQARQGSFAWQSLECLDTLGQNLPVLLHDSPLAIKSGLLLRVKALEYC